MNVQTDTRHYEYMARGQLEAVRGQCRASCKVPTLFNLRSHFHAKITEFWFIFD